MLKEYTADFIEMMDVLYKPKPEDPAKIADLIAFRKYAVVRHRGE